MNTNNKNMRKMLDKTYETNSLKGYYADDEIDEDLLVAPEEGGEFGTYKQCMNFELAGKGFNLVNTDNLQNSYTKVTINGKIEIEQEQDIYKYLKEKYNFNATKTQYK